VQTRRWVSTAAGWRYVDSPVGVGQVTPVEDDEVRIVELIFLAFVTLGTSFSITSALMGERDR
jgi:hypothetical protein